jgi:hypothetical protein
MDILLKYILKKIWVLATDWEIWLEDSGNKMVKLIVPYPDLTNL